MSHEDGASDLPEDMSQGDDTIDIAEMNTDGQSFRAVNAEMPEHQFDRLDELKDYLGLTWKGFLLMGYRCMMEHYVEDEE